MNDLESLILLHYCDFATPFSTPKIQQNCKTPSEEAGITIEGDNKWLTLMRNAIKYQKIKMRNKQL